MENDLGRKQIRSQMFEAAMKEKFYQLSGKYQPDRVFESLTRILRSDDVRIYFKRAWAGDLPLDQALDQMENYMGFVESSLTAAEWQT